MVILSSISSGLKFWSVNHTSVYESFELNVFENTKFLGKISCNWPNDLLFLGEISSNWPNDLLETNLYKTLKFCG